MVPEELKYTKEHEWIRLEGEIAVEGITDYAQGELTDIVYLELPQVGTQVERMKPIGVIEAVKAVTDFYAGVSGEVVEVNEKLTEEPELVNKDPYGDGWFAKFRISDSKELDSLLSAEDYKKLIEEREKTK
jgi:glycine cleavage system H protein